MIAQKEYQQRRQALAKRLPSNAVAVLPAASECLRNGDSHYRFRQDSDFYYLTGFNEPDALLVITAEGKSVLFNRPRDPLQEQWTGIRLGQDGAMSTLGVDAAYPIADLATRLPELFANQNAIYYSIGRYPVWEDSIFKAWQIVKGQIRRGTTAPEAFCDLMPILSEMRLFKSAAEIKCMQKAADISIAAHQRAMRACQGVTNEYQLEAELLYEFTRQGCRSVAYDPIVAGGHHACILHYTDNNQPLRSGDLILIDAGGEFDNYAADITRTFPFNGRFTPNQRHLYELVLRAQKAGIACIKPGREWGDIQKAMVQILTEGLVDLGLLRGEINALIDQEAYRPFYMHLSGHWLGLDVHDCGRYKMQGKWRPLEPGMVLTVEPGLYINPDHPGIEDRWKGIGIRIEDDILVTQEGHINLTEQLPVNVDDLEAFLCG